MRLPPDRLEALVLYTLTHFTGCFLQVLAECIEERMRVPAQRAIRPGYEKEDLEKLRKFWVHCVEVNAETYVPWLALFPVTFVENTFQYGFQCRIVTGPLAEDHFATQAGWQVIFEEHEGAWFIHCCNESFRWNREPVLDEEHTRFLNQMKDKYGELPIQDRADCYQARQIAVYSFGSRERMVAGLPRLFSGLHVYQLFFVLMFDSSEDDQVARSVAEYRRELEREYVSVNGWDFNAYYDAVKQYLNGNKKLASAYRLLDKGQAGLSVLFQDASLNVTDCYIAMFTAKVLWWMWKEMPGLSPFPDALPELLEALLDELLLSESNEAVLVPAERGRLQKFIRDFIAPLRDEELHRLCSFSQMPNHGRTLMMIRMVVLVQNDANFAAFFRRLGDCCMGASRLQRFMEIFVGNDQLDFEREQARLKSVGISTELCGLVRDRYHDFLLTRNTESPLLLAEYSVAEA